ncbi:VOC family protein [Flexibacterium corallicola]|uniref:VOC family protein n=1 Tax=Flexibacterium corallicola TaxID=3037259 RepID=UPI00286F92B4|nr:VOC family protein [Pseudovibrio sp. M1P-2-3]
MIGYVMLGTNDLERATSFFDALLQDIGGKKAMSGENETAWSFGESGFGGNEASFFVTKPFDKKQACVGNGTMVALRVPSAETVEKLHGKALELGAENEGNPAWQGENFFGAYFRDLDGNKLNFFYMKG